MQNGFVLKAKTAIKKVAAISAGALMTGATMFGAVSATTLADYPAPFITGGKWIGLIVVGSDAAAGDIIGATDIAATLAQGATVSAGVAGSTVTGGKSEDIKINTVFNDSSEFGNTLDDDDLAGLQDSELSIDIGSVEGDYDYHDVLYLGGSDYNGTLMATPLKVDTGLTCSNPDEDWKANIFTIVAADSIKYYYVFDENLKVGNRISNASTNDPITINFLGKNVEITSADADTITAQVGEQAFLNVDDSVVVLGKAVKLLNVASGTSPTSIVVDVAGVQETVSGTEKVNGLKIKVKETFYSDTRSERSATLIIGEDATKSYDDGDYYIGQNKDDPDWVWDLRNLESERPTIGIEWDQNLDDPTDGAPTIGGTATSTIAPSVVGDTISLPNDYIKIKMDSTIENDYRKYTVDTSVEELYPTTGTTAESSSAKVLYLHAGDGSKAGFTTATGSFETDDVYLWVNSTAAADGGALRVYYKDHDDANKIRYTGQQITNATNARIGTMEFQDSSIQMNVTWGAGGIASQAGNNLNLTFEFGPTGPQGDVKMWIEESSNVLGFDYIGHSDSDTTYANDMLYQKTGGTFRDVSGWEEDTRTESGVVIKDPKAHASGDSFDFDVSGDDSDFKVRVIISGPGTTVTAARGGAVVVQPVSGVPVAKLDTEVADKTAYNMILVGGPAVNRLTAEALGLSYPTRGATALTALNIGANEATLKLIDKAFGGSKVALLVVGYEATDTRNAAGVLKDYTAYSTKLTGSQVVVKASGGVISVSAPAVTSA